MSSFRSLMDSLTRRDPMPQGKDLVVYGDRLVKILDDYQRDDLINMEFKQDVIQLIAATLDLAETMHKPLYSIDEVIKDTTICLHNLSNFLTQARQARGRLEGYGITYGEHQRLIGFYSKSKNEAEDHASQIAEASERERSAFKVIPVTISSNSVLRPEAEVTVTAKELEDRLAGTGPDLPQILSHPPSVAQPEESK